MRIGKICWLALYCACALLFLEARASASALLVEYGLCGNEATQYAPAGSKTYTVSDTCGGAGFTITTTYPTTTHLLTTAAGLGSLLYTTVGGVVGTQAIAEDELNITDSALPSGTPVALTFITSPVTGSYTYSNTLYTLDEMDGSISVNGIPEVAFGAQDLVICNPAAMISLSGCPPVAGTYPPNTTVVLGINGSGTFTLPSSSGTYDTTVGTTGLQISAEFDQDLNANGGGSSFTGDFLDPFTITDIEATDPTTGQPLSGITITGASGVSYPVNVTSAVPEPNSLWIVLASVGCCGAMRARRVFLRNTRF
jgi:hypothetical protein